MEYKFKFVLENKDGKKVITQAYTLDEIMECDMFDRIHEDLDEKYGCDGNCTNESSSLCECGAIFDGYDITDKLMWTGLKDKEEVEIYEGDVIHYKCRTGNYDHYMLVTWGFGRFNVEGPRRDKMTGGKWYMNFSNMPGVTSGKEKQKYLEVIGNTTDNPELLKD